MSKFVTETKIPMWRIVLLFALAIVGFAWAGHALGEPGITWVGVICVPILIALVLGLTRLAHSRYAAIFLYAVLIVQSGLGLWWIFIHSR